MVFTEVELEGVLESTKGARTASEILVLELCPNKTLDLEHWSAHKPDEDPQMLLSCREPASLRENNLMSHKASGKSPRQEILGSDPSPEGALKGYT
jgi:hypothetical protein